MAQNDAPNTGPKPASPKAAATPVAKPAAMQKPVSQPAAPQAVSAPQVHRPGPIERARVWLFEEGPWWLCSFVFHLVLVCSLALVVTKTAEKLSEAPSFEEVKVETPKEVIKEIERFDIGETPEDPTELSTETLDLEKPAQMAQEAEYNDDSAIFEHRGGGTQSKSDQPSLGGLGGFDIKGVGPGPAIKNRGGIGSGVGTGTHAGSGGDGSGFGGRGSGSRKAMLASGGGTRQSERAVAGALNWIARHQMTNGSWSMKNFNSRCKDGSCTGRGVWDDRSSASTALALLPFFAAGQTHESKGPYKKVISQGVHFLISNQQATGDLRMGHDMYDHGLATIALCECYGMSGDKAVKNAAQAALNFIANAQDPKGGGWRYSPGMPGDTSITGWQIMALKSGQMANLKVDPGVLEKAKAFLKTVTFGGRGGGRFAYTPSPPGEPDKIYFAAEMPLPGGGKFKNLDQQRPLTSIGLLCLQYLHVPQNDPAMIEGTAYLMQNLPDTGIRNVYYWYYATQVMHNQPGPNWDAWNRKMRRVLIDTQVRDKETCANGSWDPILPQRDQWGEVSGRLMMTSLSALTLEIYYRYLPLYKLDKDGGGAAKK